MTKAVRDTAWFSILKPGDVLIRTPGVRGTCERFPENEGFTVMATALTEELYIEGPKVRRLYLTDVVRDGKVHGFDLRRHVA